jgi:hypothetical protein
LKSKKKVKSMSIIRLDNRVRGKRTTLTTAKLAVRLYFTGNQEYSDQFLRKCNEHVSAYLDRTQTKPCNCVAIDVYKHQEVADISSIVLYYDLARLGNVRAADTKIEIGLNFAEERIPLVMINSFNTEKAVAALDSLLIEKGVSRNIEADEVRTILDSEVSAINLVRPRTPKKNKSAPSEVKTSKPKVEITEESALVEQMLNKNKENTKEFDE